jgi:hypothetical protein
LPADTGIVTGCGSTADIRSIPEEAARAVGAGEGESGGHHKLKDLASNPMGANGTLLRLVQPTDDQKVEK